MEYLYLVYDGIVIALLALFVWQGWRKGLLLSLCGLAAAIAAFLGAGFVADTFDAPAATALTPKLEAVIEERVSQYYDGLEMDRAVDALRGDNVLFNWAADAVEDTLDDSQLAHDVSAVVTTAAQAVAQRVAHSVIFALSFLALYALLILALHALNLVSKLPVLHFCNGLGGGVIGLVKGGIIVFVAVGVAALMFSSYMPDAQTLQKSFVFRFFVENNPILFFFAG